MIRKIWKAVSLVFCICLVYLGIGAMAPFFQVKELPGGPELKKQADRILEGWASRDRARLLESNSSAWEERLRLLDRGKRVHHIDHF